MRKIYISGYIDDYIAWSKRETREFLRDLAGTIISHGHRMVIGLGMGLGESILAGAVQSICRHGWMVEDWLYLQPFPPAPDLETGWEKYRQSCISSADVWVVLFGNLRHGESANTTGAEGVLREYQIALQEGVDVVPCGGTGYASREIHDQISAHTPLPESLSRKPDQLSELIEPIMSYIGYLDEKNIAKIS